MGIGSGGWKNAAKRMYPMGCQKKEKRWCNLVSDADNQCEEKDHVGEGWAGD